jgi:hypothetical protein
MLATSNGNHSSPSKLLDKSGHACVLLVPNAQLTVVVQAPGEDVSLFIDVERMVVPAENVFGLLGSHIFNPERLLIFISCLEHSAYLATFRVAPSKDFSFLSQNQSVVSSADYLLNSSVLVKALRTHPLREFDWVIRPSSHCILNN